MHLAKFLQAVLLSLLTSTVWAVPWFTGPLLAPAGRTVPKGHTNLETYLFFTNLLGVYSTHGNIIHTPNNRNIIFNPIFTHGLTDNIDLQFSAPYSYNSYNDSSSHRLGDTGVILGYQLMRQQDSLWRPNLRIALQEIIPTGRVDGLNPVNNGTDATGLGSYQTVLNFNFEHLHQFDELRYLRTRLSVGYAYAAPASIEGLSVYGGSKDTRGEINPGNQMSVDVAFELSITQEWVAVLEGFASRRKSSQFSGVPGFDPLGNTNFIGSDLGQQLTFAPAIEYNFSPNIGVIAGTWFTARGKSTAEFMSWVIALNMYW